MTIENLRIALSRLLEGEEGTDREWIDRIAEFVMDFFGYEDRILDNTLTPRDRDVFYMLEGMGLLKTEMEEATIQKGKIWRIHYWILNTEKIRSLVQDSVDLETDEENKEESLVYENLSENIWKQHK
ncbi:MAG: hypothetical protein JXA22_05105 [Candidatus Thermoplasmatota archaeon]|nr:hypothetical protein [Candidatus Thermoplasmatota archaeon]